MSLDSELENSHTYLSPTDWRFRQHALEGIVNLTRGATEGIFLEVEE